MHRVCSECGGTQACHSFVSQDLWRRNEWPWDVLWVVVSKHSISRCSQYTLMYPTFQRADRARINRMRHRFFLCLSKLHLLLSWAHVNFTLYHLHHPLMVHNILTCISSLFWIQLLRYKCLVFRNFAGVFSHRLIATYKVLQLTLDYFSLEIWCRSSSTTFFASRSAPLLKSSLMISAHREPKTFSNFGLNHQTYRTE